MIVVVREVIYIALAVVREGGRLTGVWWVRERFGIWNGIYGGRYHTSHAMKHPNAREQPPVSCTLVNPRRKQRERTPAPTSPAGTVMPSALEPCLFASSEKTQ